MFKKLTIAAALALSTITAIPAWAADNAPLLIDVLTLQDGKTYDDARGYFDAVIPIIEGHGLVRLRSMQVVKKMQGHDQVSPGIVQLWELQAENAFEKIFSDPAYLKQVELRDSIFNMPKTQLWMAAEQASE